MSFTTYKIRPGDTAESIARKVYGTEQEASRVRRANPGLGDALTPGVEITLPPAPGAVKNRRAPVQFEGENETAVVIDGKRFRFWDSVRVVRGVDTMDVIELGAPFEADAPGFRETFRPFSFKDLQVFTGGEPLFTGTMVGVDPEITPDGKTVSASGYSLPGVLNDCTPPASAFPLEFNGLTLEGIARQIADPFGLSVVFEANAGPVFERVACEPGRRALAFLTELAQQRGLLISSTPNGELLFQEATAGGAPVAVLSQGESPVVSVLPFFSPQEYYSHVTGIEPVVVGLAGSQYTVKNPKLTGVLRPITFNAPDTEGANVKTAVESKAGRMFGNMVSYDLRVQTWRDPAGQLWRPNTTIKLTAPDAMIYAPYELAIRNVSFEREADSEVATLNLVIPGAFAGEIPEALPWDV